MVKRIVVAGSRNYTRYQEAKAYIDMCIKNIREDHVLIFLSGCCRGADQLGEQYALENGFEVEYYPADWKRYGKGAGLKRNAQMAERCDYAICFWDGVSSGTAAMIAYAQKLNKTVWVKKINHNEI